MAKTIRERAEMLIITKTPTGKKILLVTNGKGLYAFPGGGIKPGESPEEAAIREALEEAGACVKAVNDPKLVYNRIGVNTSYRRNGKQYAGSCTHFFIGEFDKLDLSAISRKEYLEREWTEPLDAIRVICHNNWRYDGEVIQSVLVKALT